MAGKDWSIEGRWVEYCSCDMGCPCESMANPTQGHCTGAIGFIIDKGHCDGVSLDGMKVAATFYFPRAIHHGDGHMQPILEDTVSEEQKDAISYILTGEDQPVGTMFQIFSVIVEHHHDPITTKLDMDIDVKARSARIEAPQSLRARFSIAASGKPFLVTSCHIPSARRSALADVAARGSCFSSRLARDHLMMG